MSENSMCAMELQAELERFDFLVLDGCSPSDQDLLESILHEGKFRKQPLVAKPEIPASMNVNGHGPVHTQQQYMAPNPAHLPMPNFPPNNNVYIQHMTANVNYGGLATSSANGMPVQQRMIPPGHGNPPPLPPMTIPVSQDHYHQNVSMPPQSFMHHQQPPGVSQAMASMPYPAAYPYPFGVFYGLPPNQVPMPPMQSHPPPPHPQHPHHHVMQSNVAFTTTNAAPVTFSRAAPPPPLITSLSQNNTVESSYSAVGVSFGNTADGQEEEEEEKEEEEKGVQFDQDVAIEDQHVVEEVEVGKEEEEEEKVLESVDENEPIVEVKTEDKKEEARKGERPPAVAEENGINTDKSTPGPVAKSWASLFHSGSGTDPNLMNPLKPMAKVSPYVGDGITNGGGGEGAGGESYRGATVPVENSELVKFLKEYTLNHKSSSIKPRGLSNRSNWCFVNTILQALVSCPPFFNFMKAIPLGVLDPNNPPVPITKAIWEFVQSVEIMTTFPKLNRREKNKKSEDFPLAKTIEASTIYSMLLEMNSDTFKVIEGRQEDAEEFLTFLLNGINDEILAAVKQSSSNKDGENQHPEEEEEVDDDSDDWKEVGPKNKSCTTRRQSSAQTPLADMFQGQIRSCVQHSAGQPTATLQPFFTLQLDLQSDKVKNVNDALRSVFDTEALDGYKCTTTKKEVEASRSTSLEDLPPILILHLKRFVYDETSRGCQKLLKNIDFPVDLEIVKDILSPNSKNKFHAKQRTYKLFAVVYHNGCEATKGHYVADVYHTGFASWLRCDDSLVKPVSEATVMTPTANSLPYILFYRRGDTMMGVKDKS